MVNVRRVFKYCANCKTVISHTWYRDPQRQNMCRNCYAYHRRHESARPLSLFKKQVKVRRSF